MGRAVRLTSVTRLTSFTTRPSASFTSFMSPSRGIGEETSTGVEYGKYLLLPSFSSFSSLSIHTRARAYTDRTWEGRKKKGACERRKKFRPWAWLPAPLWSPMRQTGQVGPSLYAILQSRPTKRPKRPIGGPGNEIRLSYLISGRAITPSGRVGRASASRAGSAIRLQFGLRQAETEARRRQHRWCNTGLSREFASNSIRPARLARRRSRALLSPGCCL